MDLAFNDNAVCYVTDIQGCMSVWLVLMHNN